MSQWYPSGALFVITVSHSHTRRPQWVGMTAEKETESEPPTGANNYRLPLQPIRKNHLENQ